MVNHASGYKKQVYRFLTVRTSLGSGSLKRCFLIYFLRLDGPMLPLVPSLAPQY
jgi:hypothetical protein